MADECRDDQDQACENDQDSVQAHALHALGDRTGNGMQESGRRDRFSEGEPSGGEDDDGPEEVVEVFFGEDAGAEEKDNRDDGDGAHVAEHVLELVAHTPKRDGADRHDADEPLHAGEGVSHGSDGHDDGAFSRLKRRQEKQPDEEYGEDTNRQSDKEPDAPAWLGSHVLKGDDVLRGGNGRSSTANVGRKSNAEYESFGEVGIGRKITE